jgi:hypothetical protein
MDIADWNIDIKKTTECQIFNKISVIKYEKLEQNTKIIETEKVIENKEDKIFLPEIIFEFNENNIKDEKKLLELVYILKELSNYLKDNIRNKGFKITDNNVYNEEEFNTIIRYLIRMEVLCSKALLYFLPSGKNQSYQNLSVIPFKTSSYKPCSQKSLCYIHKQNYDSKKKCDKNHFVFDTVINDINYLIKSLEIIGLDNLNWIINDQLILMSLTENKEATTLTDYKFITKKIKKNDSEEIKVDDNNFIINKKLITKSFSVISYVLKSMFDEASCFLEKNSTKSYLIKLKD